MTDCDLARAREGATDVPLPHRAPSPKDDSTRPGQPPTREAERLTLGARTHLGRGTFSQRITPDYLAQDRRVALLAQSGAEVTRS